MPHFRPRRGSTSRSSPRSPACGTASRISRMHSSAEFAFRYGSSTAITTRRSSVKTRCTWPTTFPAPVFSSSTTSAISPSCRIPNSSPATWSISLRAQAPVGWAPHLRRGGGVISESRAERGLPVLAAADTGYARQNAASLALVVGIAVLQFFAAPILWPAGAWSAVALVLLCMAVTPLHWGLMHESIHGNLFSDSVANRRAGRMLGWFLCLSWDVMRFGHLLHHSNNRHEFDRPEAVPPDGSRARAAVSYFAKILGGHALISAVSSLGLALPSRLFQRLIPKGEPMRTAALRAFNNRERKMRIRADVGAI